MKHKQLLLLLLILSVFASVVFMPIEVVYSIDTVGRVYPARQWTLRQAGDGSVVSTLYDYRSGRHTAFQSFQLERGDIIGLNWAVGEGPADLVQLGDSVATISSFLLEQELLQRSNELAVAQASLRRLQVGRKEPVVREAAQQVDLARERLALATLNYNRNQDLLEAGVIAQAEFDVFNNEYRLAGMAVQAAESRLLDVDTGERPEDINLALSQIRAAEREIELLKAKKRRYSIVAPISGKVRSGAENGELLVVMDTSAFVLNMLLEEREVHRLPLRARVKVRTTGMQELLMATITGLSDTVGLLDSRQVRLAHAVFDSPRPALTPGMLTACTVSGDTLSLWQFTRRKFSAPLK